MPVAPIDERRRQARVERFLAKIVDVIILAEALVVRSHHLPIDHQGTVTELAMRTGEEKDTGTSCCRTCAVRPAGHAATANGTTATAAHTALLCHRHSRIRRFMLQLQRTKTCRNSRET
jgi:hypothetical protein